MLDIYYILQQNIVCTFIINNIISFILIKLIHKLLLFINKEAIWFQLHALVNYISAYLTYSDVIVCLQDPNQSNSSIQSRFAPSLVLSLHVYHALFFNLRKEDWIHHIGSCFLSTPMCFFYPNKGLAFYCFFCSGLPGAIDYTLLTLYKNKLCLKIVEKKINAYLNSYIRMPGGIIGSYLIFKDAHLASSHMIYFSNMALSSLIFINTCYFGKQAIENYGVWKNNRKIKAK